MSTSSSAGGSTRAAGGFAAAGTMLRPSARAQGDRWILGALSLIALLSAWVASGGAAVEDTWRDLYVADQISSGASLPFNGPVIGGIFYLGPIWFYLLAPAFAFGGAKASLALVGLLSGLKWPLAYVVGRQALDRRFGLLLVLALLAPGWAMLELVWLTHTSVVTTSLLGLLCIAYFYRSAPSVGRAAWLGVMAALTVHAHPSTLLLGAAIVAFAIAAPATPSLTMRLRHLAVAGLVATVFVLPPLLLVLSGDAAGVGRLQRYAGHGLQSDIPSRTLPLLRGVFWAGPEWIVNTTLVPAARMLQFAVYCLGLLLALLGLVRAGTSQKPGSGHFRPALALLAALLLQTAFLLWLRPFSPFWMIYPHTLIVAALLALGWHGLWTRGRRWQTALLIVACSFAIGQLIVMHHVALPRTVVRMPAYPPGSFGPLSVDSLPEGWSEQRIVRLPTTQMQALGEQLCAPVSVYGHLAAWADESFGVGVRLACDGVDQVRIGGPLSAGDYGLLGLTDATRRELGLMPAENELPLALYPVQAVWTRSEPLSIVAGGQFPRRPVPAAASDLAVGGTARGSAFVVISNNAADTHPLRIGEVLADGRRVEPIAEDRFLAVFRCEQCQQAARVDWSLSLHGSAQRIDVLVIDH